MTQAQDQANRTLDTTHGRPTSGAFYAEVTIRRVRFSRPETGWAVVEAAASDGVPVILVGPLTHLEERERAQITGAWEEDPRYGPQVKVTEARPLEPADAETLIAVLTRVKHIGPKRAQRLIERFGPQAAIQAIDRDPAAGFAAVGLKGRAIAEAGESWEALRVTRRLHLLLAPHGLAYLAGRIHAEYGQYAHRILIERPYELTNVFGVGFAIADRIARTQGIPPESRDRTAAGVLHLLLEAERGGSTCLPLETLLTDARALLGVPVQAGLIAELAGNGTLAQAGPWIYRMPTALLEAELAHRVRELIETEPSERLRATSPRSPDGLDPNPAQRQAIANAFAHRLSLITGGPGTGKTTTIKGIAAAALGRSAKVMLVAPTGRAAIRMSEAAGVRARTVHSALGWVPGEGPEHDQDDPLECDLLIVDESSMANLKLLVTLLRAVGERTSVVLVGDADQLAPVGAGKPFADLVASSQVPTVMLEHIFRQAAGSMIVQGAHAIRRGRAPSFRPGEGQQRDLFLIERPRAQAAREEIVDLVCERLPRHYDVDPVKDIQVFAPVYRGELGIDALNQALRQRLNPTGEPVRGGRLRIGDKLMMTGRNLHELDLMNGTVLRLIDEVTGEDDDAALVLAGDERVFRLPPHESDQLQLAYACSVHRGQGIELPVAVIVAHPAAGSFFLRREMLYTAVTRAKLATVIVGDRSVIARAAGTPDTARRHSRLAERLAA